MKKTPKLPECVQYDTILEGIEKMQPAVEQLRNELRRAQKAKREGKPKRAAYHMNRTVNILFNLDLYFWSPMFQWAQSESFWKEFKHKQTPMQKALSKAAKKAKKNA